LHKAENLEQICAEFCSRWNKAQILCFFGACGGKSLWHTKKEQKSVCVRRKFCSDTNFCVSAVEVVLAQKVAQKRLFVSCGGDAVRLVLGGPIKVAKMIGDFCLSFFDRSKSHLHSHQSH
jgi:hypothetical protein